MYAVCLKLLEMLFNSRFVFVLFLCYIRLEQHRLVKSLCLWKNFFIVQHWWLGSVLTH